MKTKYLCIFLPVLLYVGTSLAQTSDSPPQQPVIENTSNLPDGTEYKKIDDIDQRFIAVKNAKIKDIARAIAEVDEWFYAPGDEKQARDKIDNEIEKLRAQIEIEVRALSKAALEELLKAPIEAPGGRIASEKMSKINVLLSYYPAPKTPEKRTQLEKITSNVLDTSRRIEDILRLRYNSWAILQIKSSLAFYRHEVKVKVGDLSEVKNLHDLTEFKNQIKIKTDKNALMNACIAWMSPINPAFLEPVVMDLYNYAFGLTRDAMDGADDFLIVLTQGFTNPNTKRKTPSDF